MRLFGMIAHLLFPEKCMFCGRVLQRPELDLCSNCRREQPEIPKLQKKIPFLSGSAAVWYYRDNVRKSLLRFKFGQKRSYADGYARFLAMKLLDRQQQYDLITWVPVSRFRKLCRGYDQGELLALALCRQLGRSPVRCLVKVRNNTAQSRIKGLAQRRANVLGVYRVSDPQLVAGKRILLLDDIITTGSTISECAKTLLTAGAIEVYGAAVAAKHHK